VTRLIIAIVMAMLCMLTSLPVLAAPASVDVNGLRLPATAFSPATASGPSVVLNNDADHGYFNWLHSASYTHFHRVSGVGEDARWQATTGSGHVVEFL